MCRKVVDPVMSAPHCCLDARSVFFPAEVTNLSKPYNQRRVVGSPAQAVFLSATVDLRGDFVPSFDDQGANALGASEFVCREARHGDVGGAVVSWNVRDSLCGIGEEGHSTIGACLSDLFYVVDEPCLVVDVHDADEDGVVSQSFAKRVF